MGIIEGLKPADLSLADLQVFYDPKIIESIAKEIESTIQPTGTGSIKKVMIGGSLILALNAHGQKQQIISFQHNHTEESVDYCDRLKATLDFETKRLNSEVEAVSAQLNQLEDSEVLEIEVLNTYYSIAGDLYDQSTPFVI